jgi:hypothetical protein
VEETLERDDFKENIEDIRERDDLQEAHKAAILGTNAQALYAL